jgi:hypothetical protein
MDEHQWIAMAKKHLHVGAFTKQAKAHGETPKEFMNEVLAHPEKHTETTRKRAQFMKNIQPQHHSEPVGESEHSEAPSKAKKTKRAPSAWNQMVTKHYAMVKGEPDAFKKAIKMAQEERAGGSAHTANPKSPNPKKEAMAKKEAPSKKKLQLHLTEYEDS